jgi:hypothetical protein
VRCSWDGGHNWLFDNDDENGQLVVDFLLRWTKPSHAGMGRRVGEGSRAAALLEHLAIVGDHDPGLEAARAHVASRPRALDPVPHSAPPSGNRTAGTRTAGTGTAGTRTAGTGTAGTGTAGTGTAGNGTAGNGTAGNGTAGRAHYGNPAEGCREDEDTITVLHGRTCAPRVASDPPASPGELPRPQCKLGGVAPSKNNGCPTDAAVDVSSKAWPMCLATANPLDPYTSGDFHCALACPCLDVVKEGTVVGCGAEADAHCPAHAKCLRAVRFRSQGVCGYV